MPSSSPLPPADDPAPTCQAEAGHAAGLSAPNSPTPKAEPPSCTTQHAPAASAQPAQIDPAPRDQQAQAISAMSVVQQQGLSCNQDLQQQQPAPASIAADTAGSGGSPQRQTEHVVPEHSNKPPQQQIQQSRLDSMARPVAAPAIAEEGKPLQQLRAGPSKLRQPTQRSNYFSGGTRSAG